MEPERRIEKWLRAFAKKRREQAGGPMELRPAARERLQREAARQAEERSRGGFFSGLFFGPRPRLVFAATFAALVIGALILLPPLGQHRKPTQLSMNKASPPETLPPAVTLETPPPVATSPAVASADKKVVEEKRMPAPAAPAPPSVVVSANRALAIPPPEAAKQRDRAESVFQQKQLTVTTVAASAPPTTNLSLAFKNEAAAGALANADGLPKDAEGAFPTIIAPQSSNPVADTMTSDGNAQSLKSISALQRASAINGTNTALFDLAKSTSAATVSQVFNRLQTPTTRRAEVDSTAAPIPVLASFRVEQSGNNLKVFDRDGSVYTGAVQIAQQEPYGDYSFTAAKNGPVGAARAAKTGAPAPQNYFFRVTGTNRNLNANVVFSGNFVPFTNAQAAAGTRGFGGASGFGGGGGGGGGRGGAGQTISGSDQAAAQPVQAILSNSQITGNVVIDNQKAIDVIATPAH